MGDKIGRACSPGQWGPNSRRVWQINCWRKQGQNICKTEFKRSTTVEEEEHSYLDLFLTFTASWEIFQAFQEWIYCDILTLYKQNMTPLSFWGIVIVSIQWHTPLKTRMVLCFVSIFLMLKTNFWMEFVTFFSTNMIEWLVHLWRLLWYLVWQVCLKSDALDCDWDILRV